MTILHIVLKFNFIVPIISKEEKRAQILVGKWHAMRRNKKVTKNILSTRAVTFKSLDVETILVYRYIFRMSRSNSYIEVMESR